MMGNVRWNLYGGAGAFVLNFLFSISHNVLLTSLLHSVYSFVLVFLLIFLFRFVLHLILSITGPGPDSQVGGDNHAVSETGQNVDLATPSDDTLHDLLRPNGKPGQSSEEGGAFAPLKPPKLMSQSDLDPEELANALRRMSEE